MCFDITSISATLISKKFVDIYSSNFLSERGSINELFLNVISANSCAKQLRIDNNLIIQSSTIKWICLSTEGILDFKTEMQFFSRQNFMIWFIEKSLKLSSSLYFMLLSFMQSVWYSKYVLIRPPYKKYSSLINLGVKFLRFFSKSARIIDSKLLYLSRKA